MNELTKSEKRKCRELIQLGLNRECAKFVEQIRNLSQTTSEDPHAQYIAIYRKTRTFDKHVAWRYDDMRGSKYLPTVASLLADKVIREDESSGSATKTESTFCDRRVFGRREKGDQKDVVRTCFA